MDNRESNFVRALAQCESDDRPYIWGDSGRAAGRWQIHPSCYATWGPKPQDFGVKERDWNWAFEFAISHFFQYCVEYGGQKTDLEIAMAWHLHGQARWDGWDKAYAERFLAALHDVEKS